MEKIVEKCRAPGKKTGSCEAAEAYAVCKGRRFTVCEANGELQANVNGTFRGARLSKGRREKQVIGCRKWWEVSCVRDGCIIRFFSFFPG